VVTVVNWYAVVTVVEVEVAEVVAAWQGDDTQLRCSIEQSEVFLSLGLCLVNVRWACTDYAPAGVMVSDGQGFAASGHHPRHALIIICSQVFLLFVQFYCTVFSSWTLMCH